MAVREQQVSTILPVSGLLLDWRKWICRGTTTDLRGLPHHIHRNRIWRPSRSPLIAPPFLS